LLNWASEIPDMLMQDASWHNQLILQWLSKSPTAQEIDGEIGKLEEDLITDVVHENGFLSYLRYNCLLDTETLNQLKPNGKTYTKAQVKNLLEMSKAENRYDLYDIGAAAAQYDVKEAHFPKEFTLKNELVS
jgi:hypothetical protein